MDMLFNPLVHLRCAGVCLLLLVGLNLFMPRYFKWPEELAKLSLLTRQIFIVHALFIGLVLLFMAILSLFFTRLLLAHSLLASLILAAMGLFWTVRLGAQFFIYSPKLWRGHRFNTAMHILFSCLWVYFVVVYSAACIGSFR